MSLAIDVYNELTDLVKSIPNVFDFSQEFIDKRLQRQSITEQDEQREVSALDKIIQDNKLTNVEQALIDPEVRLNFINFIMGDDDIDSGDVVKWAWDKVQSHIPTAPIEDKFNTAWNYIKHFPSLKKEMVEEMRRVGFVPKSNPFCVMGKMDKGDVSKDEAKNECIDEGKLNPMNAIAFERRYHFEG